MIVAPRKPTRVFLAAFVVIAMLDKLLMEAQTSPNALLLLELLVSNAECAFSKNFLKFFKASMVPARDLSALFLTGFIFS